MAEYWSVFKLIDNIAIHFGGDSIKDVYEKTYISTYICVLFILCTGR